MTPLHAELFRALRAWMSQEENPQPFAMSMGESNLHVVWLRDPCEMWVLGHSGKDVHFRYHPNDEDEPIRAQVKSVTHLHELLGVLK